MPLNQSETTVAAASQEIHAPVRQESSQRHKSYFIFTLCAIVYLLPFMRVFLPWNNEGEFIYGAVRIVHGQVFARDFFASGFFVADAVLLLAPAALPERCA